MLTAVARAWPALVSRLWDISYPRDLLFDEAYYPPEAHELLTWGFEYNRGYSFIVHPPLGKWLIAAGEQLFGYNSLGWRFPSRGGRRDRRRRPRPAGPAADRARPCSACSPGLLLALDGFSFTLSRIGLLDVFLQVFVLGAVACLVVDRDQVRAADPRRRRPGDRTGSGSGRAAGGSPPASCSAAPAR